MKVRYDKDEDILMIELVRKKVDDSYELKDMIVHVSENKESVLLEIFNATEFLKNINKSLPSKIASNIFSP